jgi:hypothetical protein
MQMLGAALVAPGFMRIVLAFSMKKGISWWCCPE